MLALFYSKIFIFILGYSSVVFYIALQYQLGAASEVQLSSDKKKMIFLEKIFVQFMKS